ncbi:MAG: hypothetical protein ACJ8FY_17905 [Gemmataceae bacterium]
MLAELATMFSGEITPLLIPLVAIVGGLLVPIVYLIGRMRQTELEINLKNEMISRGMSVEEIERVLRASGPPDLASCRKRDSQAS